MGYLYIFGEFSVCLKRRRFTIRSKILLGYLVLCFYLELFCEALTARTNVLQKENDFISHHDLEVHNLTNADPKKCLEHGDRDSVDSLITGNEKSSWSLVPKAYPSGVPTYMIS